LRATADIDDAAQRHARGEPPRRLKPAVQLESTRLEERPIEIAWPGPVIEADGSAATVSPERSTVTSSDKVAISSILWVMNNSGGLLRTPACRSSQFGHAGHYGCA
jgi:hypothetical protein